MAEDDLTAILRRAPGEAPDVRVRLVPLKDDLVGGVHVYLRIVMAAVALVLLTACVNVAALLLARSVKRGDEMALRVSLGAGHGRLAQQLMAEGFLLVAPASVLGVVAAWAGLRLLGRVPGLELPRLAGAHLSAAALAATGAVAVGATLLFAWVPAQTLSGLDLAAALRRARMLAGRSHRRAFSALVVAEIGCSVVLAVGAGLLLRSFWRVQHVDPGFRPDSMLSVYLRTNDYGPPGRAFWKDVLDGVAALPAVSSVALADCMPGKGAAPATLVFDDRVNDPRQAPAAQGCWISAGFFRTSGTPLLGGRSFDERDGADAPPVAIVNAEAARRYWPGRSPIGRWIGVNYTGPGRRGGEAPRRRQVVGVVAAIKQGALDAPTEPAVDMPYLQDETGHDLASMSVFVRSAGGSAVAGRQRARQDSCRAAGPAGRGTADHAGRHGAGAGSQALQPVAAGGVRGAGDPARGPRPVRRRRVHRCAANARVRPAHGPGGEPRQRPVGGAAAGTGAHRGRRCRRRRVGGGGEPRAVAAALRGAAARPL